MVESGEQEGADLSPQQEAVLTFIASYVGEYGYAPAYREIQVGMGWQSVSTAHQYVNDLVKLGRLKRGPKGSPRALTIVKDAA